MSGGYGVNGSMVKMFHWIYHGKDRKQRYYEPHCLVCYVWLLLRIIQIMGDKRKLFEVENHG